MSRFLSVLGNLPDKKTLWYLALFTFVVRVLFMLTLVDLHDENYWEYGEIARNLAAGKGYSFFYFENGKIDIYAHTSTHPFPSAYVPPGYVFFLYPFLVIKKVVMRNVLILLAQHLVAAFTCRFIFRLTRLVFNAETAWVAALIFALLPELVYASNSFGPTVFYHFIVVLICLQLLIKEPSLPRVMSSAGLFATAMYFRGEVALFLGAVVLFHILRKRILSAFVLLVTAIVLMLPWQIRNYKVFHHFIPISTSTGINLYRGNNADGIGSWGWEKNVYANSAYLTQDSLFELRYSGMYKQLAMDYIRSHPKQTLVNAVKKLGYLWIIQPDDPRSKHPAYWLPWLLMGLTFLFGLMQGPTWQKMYPVYLFLISCSLTAVIFFALPRYQTLMKIAVIPIAAAGFTELLKRIKKG